MIHPLIRAAILFGFAMFIVYLNRTGEMILYIAPRMELYVKLSALGLYAAAAYQLFTALQLRSGRSIACAECDHTPSPSIIKNILIYGIFVLPLLLGFLMPTGTLGSALAAKKGISLTGSASVSRDRFALEWPMGQSDSMKGDPLNALFPYDEYTKELAAYGKELYSRPQILVSEQHFIETLTVLDMYRDAFIGKEVEITGFVYREETMNSDQLIVGRFAMNCCSADALPYGVLVEWPAANGYNEDDWVKATGQLATTTYLENEIIMLKLTRIERIAAPDTPYVYPDLSFDFE